MNNFADSAHASLLQKNLLPGYLFILPRLQTFFFASMFSFSDFSPHTEFYVFVMENQNGG